VNWDACNHRFMSGHDREAVAEARKAFQTSEEADWRWLAEALEDDDKKWFVSEVFRECPVPKPLFEPFIRAAIYETNPSLNRQFMEPCVDSFGHRRVNERLLDYVEGNDNFEIAGAVAALYWANVPIVFPADAKEFTFEHATTESCSAYLTIRDVWERKRVTFLTVFVSNEDVSVRRQIIPSLNLAENDYPDDLKPLVRRAIEIARNHSDDYIRHRIEVQLGNEHLFRPIPTRQKRV